ncbi:MAG TPA: hypothetical protein VLF93_02425 [Candidatus Saccharimonadales bacterium]|nr:hypothetical protein [Candidatus Saccharimonadales bacterium]
MGITETGGYSEEREIAQAVERDYRATTEHFLITEPDILMGMILDLSGYTSSEKALLEKGYKATKKVYGSTTRKLSDTPALLHAVRVAYPNPSEGTVPIETTLGRLFHDLSEMPFGINPQDFQEYGSGTVLVVRALSRRHNENYFLEYLPRAVAADNAHPELLIVPTKAGKDLVDNCLDPFALPLNIDRLPPTQRTMIKQHDKYEDALFTLFPRSRGPRRRELVTAEKSMIHALAKGRQANQTPQLALAA